MKGDFTRDTFRRARHSWGVLRQQGRVDLDADWNEQVRIGRHQDVARTEDVVGGSGGPAGRAGFAVEADGSGAVSISAGRYYVGGVLCENDADVAFADQPLHDPDEPLPVDGGLHLAWLDVWDRQVTAHADPTIREVALGGPDTATRATTAWRVRTTPLAGPSPELGAVLDALAAARAAADADAEEAALHELRRLATEAACDGSLEPLGGSLEPGTGTMAARAGADAGTSSDPCRFQPGGGYRRLENRLYRVEIHEGGPAASATFKWSRDNGSMTFGVERFLDGGDSTSRLVVRRLGFDSTRSLRRDDWVEVTSDADERAGRPGALVRIVEDPDPADRILVLSDPVGVVDPELHPVVRRWDGGETDVRAVWQELEDGVEVRFGGGTYHPGDYWTVPARTNTADVEWPPYPSYPGEVVTATPLQVPPAGIERRRAPLAVLAHDGADVVAAVDRRRLFAPATEGVALVRLGGDGQAARPPGGEVPWPLRVGVLEGGLAAPDRLVRFQVVDGGGTLEGGGVSGSAVVVPTDPHGVASVSWTVELDATEHRVEARLLDACADPADPSAPLDDDALPVWFAAHLDWSLRYLSGTGQEGLPGDELEPLRVWVSDGRFPVEGARVEFTVTGGGSLDAGAPVETGPDGVAEVTWTLGPDEHRQAVVARLLEVEGAAPVHEASVTFHANLSRAAEVAYTPASDCSLGDVGTVQEALDALCRRETEEGGTCRVVVSEGADLRTVFEGLSARRFEGAVCIEEGTFEVDGRVVLEEAGDVIVRGVGPATRIVARRGGTALAFAKCGSVTVRDLSVATLEQPSEETENGALHFEECAAVTVESVRAACPSGSLPRVAAIAVLGRSGVGAPVRVRGCDLDVGLHQVGILATDVGHLTVEGNVVRPGDLGDLQMEALVNDEEFVERVVDNVLLFSEPRDGEISPVERPGDTVRTEGGGRTFEFRTLISTSRTWQAVLRERGIDTLEEHQAEATRTFLTETLRQMGNAEETTAFRRWFVAADKELTASPYAGIRVRGDSVGDVRILHNALYGCIHGIVVDAQETDRLQVTGNTVDLVGTSPTFFEGTGVAVGSCDSVVVSDTAVGGPPVDLAADRSTPRGLLGVVLTGVRGPQMIVRGGRYAGTAVGVRVVLENEGTWPRVRRWVASDNVATDGVMLDAPCAVVEDGNVPPRPEPCPDDQPAGRP